MQDFTLHAARESILSWKWRTWLIVAGVLLATHALSAWHYGARYENDEVLINGHVLTLDMTPDEWGKQLGSMDAAAYLKVAENYAAGRGVTMRVSDAGSTHDAPFFYWGPGAPVVFGTWLKLVGRETMWPFFWFAVFAQLIFGAISVATASLWTRNTWALGLVALCSGFCPPMQQWFYGACLTSSEIVVLVPLSASIFALAKGFAVYHESVGTFWANALRWRVAVWFALAGVLIGLNSIVRDSGEVVATFIVVFLVGRALIVDRRRLILATCAAAVLLAGVNSVRVPVKRWNKHRIGIREVSTGVAWGVWFLSLWPQHDKFAWYVTAGVGFGEYLDPAAAKRVEEYFLAKKPHPELYSLGQLAQAVWKRPVDAVAFKAVRLPVLWLGTADKWPNLQFGLVPWWCIGFYGSFAAFCGIQLRRRQQIPEVLYIYLLLIISASMVIHYEFRYTFPIWNTLILSPGLLIAAATRNCRQPELIAPRLSEPRLLVAPEPRAEVIAA